MAGSGGKTTIYDIARLAGASPSTVSAVLNGSWARRRISTETVETIRRIAAESGYSINMQARGLRQARSGLVGMIIPLHDNRFFSSLSQHFDTLARERGLCPVIASTLRDPREEQRVVATLISYAVDALFIAGATDPQALGDMCAAAGLRHIFVDLPGRGAPSVVTDNFNGARQLTARILAETPALPESARSRPYFLGGTSSDYATARRIEAFQHTLEAAGLTAGRQQIIECGYAPSSAARAIQQLCHDIGGLPERLFVNSLTAFEGVMSYFVTLPPQDFAGSAIGCFDYDPFAAFLQFPVYMVRQDSRGLVAAAYRMLDENVREPRMIEIEPELIAPRTIVQPEYGALG